MGVLLLISLLGCWAFFKLSCHLLVRNVLFLLLRELLNPDMVGGPDGASAEEGGLE